jgi:hypothetical protein
MMCSFVYLIPHLDLILYIVHNQFIFKGVTEKEYIEACSVENADYKLICKMLWKKLKLYYICENIHDFHTSKKLHNFIIRHKNQPLLAFYNGTSLHSWNMYVLWPGPGF